MQYMLLIYSDETGADQVTQEEQIQMMNEYNAYTDELRKRGAMVAGEALHPTTSATTVRLQDGKRLVTDGPFAETKEALGGFYLLNCKDLDEAIGLAALCPGARYGSIELRPVMEF